MHEYSLAVQIINVVEETVKQQGLSIAQLKHCAVKIAIGQMTTINPDTIDYCLRLLGDQISPGILEPVIETIPVEIFCNGCNRLQTIHAMPLLLCPNCNSPDVEIRKGTEFMVLSIEIE